ncbi:hypothetical protein EDD85DRAFT_1020317 [Armillaria nabsnona]|nr:hypothetical protein EDD85DRAFT_1020317 [Armillaria nabsnona]
MLCVDCALDLSFNLKLTTVPRHCPHRQPSESTSHNPFNDKKRRRDSSSESLPPNKRQRLGPFKAWPHKDFFFEDGDIILETYPCLFRVHSQKLREKLGGFFDDLFDLPEAAEGNPTIYGIRSITLPWVDARDVVFLLAYTYKDMPLAQPIRLKGGEEYPAPLTAWLRLDYTLSLLHTSSRFNCTRLRQKCVGALSTLFRDFSTRTARPPIVCEATSEEEEFKKTWAIKALNIFEECNVPAFLPIACYYVAQLPEEHIRDGVPISSGKRVVKIESQNTIDSILEAREALTCCRERAWRWLFQPSDAHRPLCERPQPDDPLDTCRGVLNRVGKHLKKLGFFERRTDSLETLHPVAVSAIVKELCPHCSLVTKKRIDGTNRVTWNALPRIFGLQKWPDLMAMQKTYVSGEDF